MKVSGDSRDELFIGNRVNKFKQFNNSMKYVLNFTAPEAGVVIRVFRKVNTKDIEDNENLKTMPGFHIRWSYNQETKPDAKYELESMTTRFRRFVTTFLSAS